ncbi:uncharacterized protein Bfra_002248 [Botrytis fragariae]|uniref:Uncharacterized protein n=1 Tax=Botrytis fragariae TaxID=1964551 RepID=A0A8H6EKR4_9HELO|nr:uncharacterized protein Bfra_002248 [Botrytis fragariae]KAF5875852.1 hypothetical protein Bfra_002248 [Botrytis fragariae]
MDQSVTHFHTSRKFEGCFEDFKVAYIDTHDHTTKLTWISSKQQPLLQSPSLLARRCLELNAAKAKSNLLLLEYKHNFRLRLPRPCPC